MMAHGLAIYKGFKTPGTLATHNRLRKELTIEVHQIVTYLHIEQYSQKETAAQRKKSRVGIANW